MEKPICTSAVSARTLPMPSVVHHAVTMFRASMSIAFTGEIYNVHILSRELRSKGHVLDTASTKKMIEARRPVAMFSMAIGDHLIALPALRALAANFNGRLALSCSPRAREIFFSDLSFRATYEIHGKTIRDVCETQSRKLVSIRFDVDSLVRQVSDCDLFVSLNAWHSPSVDQLLERLPDADSIGFFPSFDVELSHSHGRHAIDTTFEIPRFLNPSLRLEDYSAAPAISPEIRQCVGAWRARLPASAKVLAVQVETRPSKMWPIKRFVRTLDRFLDNNREVIVIALGTRDLGLGEGEFGQRIVPCYNFYLPCAMAMVGAADLFFGIDSCMLHVADLFRVPGLGLFGPSNCTEYGFRFAPHRHICGPDQTMASIGETEVLDALESLYKEVSHL